MGRSAEKTLSICRHMIKRLSLGIDGMERDPLPRGVRRRQTSKKIGNRHPPLPEEKKKDNRRARRFFPQSPKKQKQLAPNISSPFLCVSVSAVHICTHGVQASPGVIIVRDSSPSVFPSFCLSFRFPCLRMEDGVFFAGTVAGWVGGRGGRSVFTAECQEPFRHSGKTACRNPNRNSLPVCTGKRGGSLPTQ